MRKPTPQSVRRYVESGGCRCPACGSHEITGDAVEIEKGRAVQQVYCEECTFLWKDIYRLDGIEAVD